MRLPAVVYYETAFRKATGASLRLVPPEPTGKRMACGLAGNPFCALVAGGASGGEACLQAETRLQRHAARRRAPQQIHCFAGLTLVAVPVMIGGQHMATLLAGQVFRREPTHRDFALVVKMLPRGLDGDWEKKARHAYFETPVVTAERFQAIIELVQVFAQYIADSADRCAIADSNEEPRAVVSAKAFVRAHSEEPVTLRQVAQYVHVSPFYFCKVFKRATGMTLTEYVARVRVEKAKTLLADPSRRVSEVVFEAGFGSIPRFNSVFKRHVGMAATQYRAALRAL